MGFLNSSAPSHLESLNESKPINTWMHSDLCNGTLHVSMQLWYCVITLLGAKGIVSRSKRTPLGAPGLSTRSKRTLLGAKGHVVAAPDWFTETKSLVAGCTELCILFSRFVFSSLHVSSN